MTTLYRLLTASSDSSTELLDDLHAFVAEGTLVGAAALRDNDLSSFWVVRDGARARVFGEDIPKQFRGETRFPADSAHCVAVAINQETPEAVGLAWEVIVAASVLRQSSVWLAESAFGRATIARHGGTRPFRWGSDSGHVLESSEFASLVEQAG